MPEIWKDIPGYEEMYQASTIGRIRTAIGKKTFSTRWNCERTWESRILKPKACANYYRSGYRVTLWKNKQSKDFLVARLVAATFLGESLQTKLTVNHKDGDRLNNDISNLEWVTLSENIRYGFANEQFPQNQTALTNLLTKEKRIYRSMEEAGKAIGRCHGYISDSYSKNRRITSKDGIPYKVSVTRTKSTIKRLMEKQCQP